MLPSSSSPNPSLFPILLTIFAATVPFSAATTNPATSTFIYAGCSPSKFPPNSPFQDNLNSLLASLAFSSSRSSYSSSSSPASNSTSPSPSSPAFGLFQCRPDLALPDCSACVQSAVGQLSLICSDSYAASLQLDGCFVRYSSDDFLGRPDASLAYKKCGAKATSDPEFFRRRGDVLADLGATGGGGGGGFKVSSSGAVQGTAQCLGDIGAADCASCIGQAVAALRDACGSAMAADVFLAQCYARYWASGYYQRSSTDYSDDDIGRTVAIIVGIIAGLALIVVFLSFLKTAC